MSQSSPPTTRLSLTEKRMLLAELLREKAKQDTVFPLSHGQRGLWFLSQLDRDGAAYNLFFPARIRSRIDVPAFRRALQILIARHPSLRTTFEQYQGELRQRVHSSLVDAEDLLEIHDASSWSEEVLHERIEEEAYRPLDLERGPLVRMHLFSRSVEEHYFLLTAHHIIGDFWSLVLLMEEMQELYPAECAGISRTLPALTAHYRDFVRWQAEMLVSGEGERLLSYWQKQLAGVAPVLELPTDRPRPPRFRQRGAAVSCRLEPDLVGRLKALAVAEGVTLYTILLAALEVLLGRHSGQEDFVIGSPFAGRSRPEFERVVGCFINLLPLRAQLSGDPTIRELLHQTSATVLEALQHQDYPFSLLVERLGLPHDPSRPSLVQVSFTLEKAHRPVGLGCWSFFLPHAEVRLNFGGLPAEPYCLEQRACQMDLEMILEEGDNALYGIIRYNTDLFDEQTIVRLAGRYHILLKSILEDQQKRISELSLLTPAEQRCLLYEWNDTAVDYPRDVCLHQLFEQQAARSPQAVALRYGLGDTDGVSVPKGEERCAVGSVQGIVRYGELEAWANRLARLLQQWGVGPDVRVALCLERSPAMIAAMLGVLKAGGAYVPLDPASPLERLRSILIDIRPAVLLTQRWLAKRLPDLKMQVFCVEELAASDQNGRTPSAATFQTETRPPHPNDLAYVIYT